MQNLSRLLNFVQPQEIEIRRRDGGVFTLKAKKEKRKPPFDVPGIKTKATTEDITDAVRESRDG